MPTFEYIAKQSDGSESKGVIYGSSLDSAVADLQKRGLEVHSIHSLSDAGMGGFVGGPSGATGSGATGREETSKRYEVPPVEGGPETEARSYMQTSVVGPLVGRVSLASLSFFFTQLGTMLQAGVPIVQSLDTLSKQATDPKFRTILAEMKGHAEAGRPMTAGMQRYPEVFTPVMVSLVRTGEEGGFLDESLFTAAKYTEDEIEIRNLYRRVTIYPKLLVGASIIIIAGANLIISSISSQAAQLKSPLTTLTTWFWLAPIIIGLFLFFRVGLANFKIRYFWDQFVGYIPYVGKTAQQMSMTKFGRSFGAMYKSGVPLPRAIQLAADSCGNEYMRAKLYPCIQVLESGAGITETMRSTGVMNPIVLDMLATGEKTGNVDHMLNKMSDYFHEESKSRAIILGYFVGVAVLMCVAMYIGYIVIGFYQNMGQQTTEMVNQT
ncbi:MAG: type II secretion system F family protein [Fimbriimonadales bacterium]|nr:type II secretion system F family protein [Fimbriimonadales bacterium]